jgi:hypothetical protein
MKTWIYYRPKLLFVRLAAVALKLKRKILGFYYEGLAVQAEYLYAQSPLFKECRKIFGLESAEKEFRKNGSEVMRFSQSAARAASYPFEDFSGRNYGRRAPPLLFAGKLTLPSPAFTRGFLTKNPWRRKLMLVI